MRAKMYFVDEMGLAGIPGTEHLRIEGSSVYNKEENSLSVEYTDRNGRVNL